MMGRFASKSSSKTLSGSRTYVAGVAIATSGRITSHLRMWYSIHSRLIVMSPSKKWNRLLAARSVAIRAHVHAVHLPLRVLQDAVGEVVADEAVHAEDADLLHGFFSGWASRRRPMRPRKIMRMKAIVPKRGSKYAMATASAATATRLQQRKRAPRAAAAGK